MLPEWAIIRMINSASSMYAFFLKKHNHLNLFLWVIELKSSVFFGDSKRLKHTPHMRAHTDEMGGG